MNTELIAVDQVGEDFVNLVVVYNCFNMQDRELSKLIHDPRKSLADYMTGLPEPEKWSVSVNGELFDVGEWAAVYPVKDDFITVIPIPHGGNKGKSVLRIAAMVAIAVAAPYMVPATWGTVATSAAIAGINMAGAMVVNALLPMPTPSTPGYGDTSESSTYGVDGAKNTSTEQTSVPLIYGEYRYAGNMVNVKTENVDDTQIITSQMVVSEGPIESIGDFQVQDQPIANYEDVETITRLGVDNQAISSWFAASTRMVNKSVTLTTSHTTHLTTDVVDGFRVDLLFPSGLSEINKSDGKRLNRTVSFAIEYNRQGTSTWTSISPKQYRPLNDASILASADKLRVEYQQRLTGTGSRSVTGNLFVRVGSGAWVLKQTKTHTVSLSSGSGFLSGAFNVDLNDMGSGAKSYKVEWTGASPAITASSRYAIEPTVTAKTGQPLRRSFDSPVLAQGIYNIRIRRLNDESTSDLITDRVTLTDVAEIINERVRYNHTAFYGVRIRLSDQLNGMPRITALVKGIKVKHYDYSGRVTKTAWSNNPAWIALDMLTNRRYGAGLPLSRIDIRMFVEWAEFCAQQQLTFNGVFDSMSNIWDACQVVLRVGRARFVSVGNVYSLAIYRASEPVMMFGSGNIIEGSLQLSWQSLEDRANEFEVEYFDRENDNKPAIVRVVNEKALDRGEPQRISTLRMVGIDNQAQALKEAHFQKALNEHLIMTGQFEATVESMACGVGDVVLLQHDMPDWGESGRVKPGSTRSLINVDRPLSLAAAPVNMSFLILHPAVIRGTGVISNINTTNKIIYLTGLSTSIRGKRIRVGSKDLLVLSMSASGGYLEVVLENVSGLSVGNSVELWDTDVIETRAIQAYDAAKQQVRLSGPLSVDPQDFANYMVGKSNTAAKPVSITGISGNGEYKRMIKFIEYNATVFDPENAQPTPIYSRPITAVQHVRDLRVLEEVTMRTGSLTSDLVVSWSKPSDGNYAGAQVYMSRNGGPLLRHGTAAAGATVYHTTGVFGETMVFKVVAYDGAGRVADFDTAPIFEYSVVKSSDLPPVVQNFRATLGMDGVELMWDLIDDPDVVSYEIREGASWAAGKALVKKVASNRFFSTDKNHSYIYWIKATDVTGKQSPAASMATVVDLLKPAMPTSVDIEAASFAIKLMPNGLSPGALWEFRRSNVALATNMIESNAVKVGQSTVLVDTGLKHGTKYYYYIRGVNAFAVGDWYPVQATTKTDIPEILDALAGQVRESHLWGELNKRIDLIDGPETLANSVAQRLANEASQRVAAINTERNARIAAVTAEATARANAISAEATARATEINSERVARQNAIAAEASARAAAITKEQGDRAAAVNSERSLRISGDTALSNTIDTLTSVVNKNVADISTEKTARATADSALASDISSLFAKIDAMPSWVNGFEGIDYDAWVADSGHTLSTVTSGAFAGARSGRVSSSTSAAGSFEGVKVALPKATGDAFVGQKVKVSVAARWNRTSGLSSREIAISYVTTDGTAIISSGWQRFALKSNWETLSFHYTVPMASTGHTHYLLIWGDTSGSNLQAFVDQCVIQPSDVDMKVIEAAILDERSVRVSAEEALSTRIDSVNSRVNSANAAISNEATARADADTALTNTFNSALSSLNSDVMAAISSESSTRASADSALTTSINNVNARVNTANANIASEATTRANADTALTNSFNSAISSLDSELKGLISSESSTRASGDSALANQINTVQSQMGDSLATAISEVETVVNGASIVKNGMFSTGNLAGWPGTWGYVSVVAKTEEGDSVASAAPTSHMAVFADRDHASYRYLYGTYFPVTEGDEYTIRLDYAASAGATVVFDVYTQWRKADGTTTTSSFSVSDASTTWKRTAPRTFKVPAQATQARVYVRRRNGYAGALYLTNIVNYRMDDAMSAKIDTVQSSLQGDVASVQTNLNTQVSRVDGRVDAVSSSVATLTTKVNKNSADILSESSARTNADSALSTRVDAVLAKANTNAASIVNESKARADGDSALTTQVNSVLAKANANAAAITSEATARANADNALSSTINTVSAKANSNASAISTETSARISADNALSAQITTAQSTLNGQISSVEQTLSTSIANVDRRVDGMADTTNLITNGSFYTGDTNGWTSVSSATSIIPGIDRGGSIAAKFVMQFPDDQGSYSPRSTSVPVRADEKFSVSFDMAHGNNGAANRMRAFVQWIGANGSTVATHYGITQNATYAWVRYGPHVFTAPANATEARFGVQRLSGNAGVGFVTNVVANRVDAVLGAQYTLKLDVNGFVSGFGAYNDGTTSDFGVIANRFFVAAPGSTYGAMPFLVSGNSVYMNEAMIQTLTIGKLRTSTGGVVVENNRIKADYIDAANLDVRSSARFTGDVQSTNYSAGSAGWRIRQNGTAEFNQGVFNAALLVGDLSDNVTIAGVDSLGLIRQRAYAGSLSKARVDDWTRPGSTLINGNSIFTGDAYVDTLQIKGRAVTIPFYMSAGYSSTNMRLDNSENRSDWHTFTSFFVEAGATGGPANIFMEFSLAIRRYDRTNSSELINVDNAEFRIIRRDNGGVIWSGEADTRTDSLIRHTTQGTIMRNTSVPAGGVWLDVQYHITYAWKYESASWNYSANEVYASPLRVSTMVSQR